MAQINSSWSVRVKRDDLVTFQVDGTLGSAVAGLHKCSIQHHLNTPKPTWNPDQPQTLRFHDHWMQVPDNEDFGNGFPSGWTIQDANYYIEVMFEIWHKRSRENWKLDITWLEENGIGTK